MTPEGDGHIVCSDIVFSHWIECICLPARTVKNVENDLEDIKELFLRLCEL